MQGPTQPQEEPPDPRESTVSMPRVDPALLSDHVSGGAATASKGPAAGFEPPGLGDPYALPGPAPAPARANGRALRPGRVTGPQDRAVDAEQIDAPERPHTAASSQPPEYAAETQTAAPVATGPAGRRPLAAPHAADTQVPRAATAGVRLPAADPPAAETRVPPANTQAPAAAAADARVPAVGARRPASDARVHPAESPFPAADAPTHRADQQSTAAASRDPAAGTRVRQADTPVRPRDAQWPAIDARVSPAQAVGEVPVRPGSTPSRGPVAPAGGPWPRADGEPAPDTAGPQRPAEPPPAAWPPGGPWPRADGQPALDRREATAGPQRPAEPRPAAWPPHDSAATNPSAGSMADLRARLARLPGGHPSSPYDDAGRLKPAPTRLRQLELGLPARSRGYADRFAADADDDVGGTRPGRDLPTVIRTAPAASPGVRAADSERADHGPADEPGTSAASAAETGAGKPIGPARPPREHGEVREGAAQAAGPAGSAAPPAQGQNGHHGSGTRSEWQHPYAVPGERDLPGDGPDAVRRGDLALRPWPGGDQEPPADRDGQHRADSTLAPGSPAPGQPRQRPQNGRPGLSPGERGRPDTEQNRISRQEPTETGSGPLPGPRRDDRRPEPGRTDPSRTDPGRTAPDDPGSGRSDPGRIGRRQHPSGPLPAWPGPATSHPGDRARTDTDGRRASGARHPGGPARDQLGPGPRQLVDRILAASRVAEGQNSVGGYGNSGLTPAIRRIAAQLPAGGLAPGSEADTLKPADRLTAKLARLIARQPGRSVADLAAGIPDAIRYAFTFPAADYTDGTWLVHRKLKAQGFDLEVRRNRWDSPEYKGVFTCWRDPAHGQLFEVQFHSTDSWAVVKQTHDAYVLITDPATPPAERARLRARQVAAAAAVQPPPGWTDIADFRAAR